MKAKFLLYVFATIMFVSLPSLSKAQIGDFDPGGDPDVPVPFDGGISLLVAAGIGYGVKKAYAKRKKVEATVNFIETK